MCSVGRYTPRRSAVTWNSSVANPKVWSQVRFQISQGDQKVSYQETKYGNDQHEGIGRELAQTSDIHGLFTRDRSLCPIPQEHTNIPENNPAASFPTAQSINQIVPHKQSKTHKVHLLYIGRGELRASRRRAHQRLREAEDASPAHAAGILRELSEDILDVSVAKRLVCSTSIASVRYSTEHFGGCALLRYAKSGISPAPNAYVSAGSRTSRTVRTRRVVASGGLMVGCEEETGAEGLIIREHDCVVAMMSRLGTRDSLGLAGDYKRRLLDNISRNRSVDVRSCEDVQTKDHLRCRKPSERS